MARDAEALRLGADGGLCTACDVHWPSQESMAQPVMSMGHHGHLLSCNPPSMKTNRGASRECAVQSHVDYEIISSDMLIYISFAEIIQLSCVLDSIWKDWHKRIKTISPQ